MNKKDSCPDECGLKSISTAPAVWVPPPQRHPFAGIIISRDPTTAFIPFYNEAKEMDLPKWREHLFATDAIPRWVCSRIEMFNRKYMDDLFSKEELGNFRDTLYNSVYWTHLHKCCTDNQKKDSLNFRQRNARQCADRWLKSEIEAAAREDIRFIITLGKDVERWFENNCAEIEGIQNGRLYHLPHPSGAAMGAWHPKDEQKQRDLEEKIRGLVLECQ
ncbi:MAG: hypothetical protein JW931_01850 [Methanomicrobiaceae archaeon]|nr:hypothetical protein [Methanomicrobiaceae archaeon]